MYLAGLRGLGQRPNEQSQRSGRETRTRGVERRGIDRFLTLLEILPGQISRARGDRHIDKKNRPPSDRIDDPSADNGSQSAGQGAGRGPGTDGAAPRLAGKRAPENGKTVGHQQRSSQPLQSTRSQEPRKRRRRRASHRGKRKSPQSYLKQSTPAEMIAQRAAEQNQHAQRQQDRVDRPRQIDGVDLQVVGQRG